LIWIPHSRRKNARRAGCDHVGSCRVFLPRRGLRRRRGRGRRFSHCAEMDKRDALGLTMHPVIPPRYVSLIGLPGSGKTTLCRSLAKALGWRAFVIGDALRARAASDATLKAMLDQRQLAPRNSANELVREAGKEGARQGLVSDG